MNACQMAEAMIGDLFTPSKMDRVNAAQATESMIGDL